MKKFSLLEAMQDETAQSNNNALGVLSNHMDAVHLIQKRLLDDIDNNYLLMLDCLYATYSIGIAHYLEQRCDTSLCRSSKS